MIFVFMGIMGWATLAGVSGFVAALLVRFRGPYEPGESFDGWWWRVSSRMFFGGAILAAAIWSLGYMNRVRLGEVGVPGWVRDIEWLGHHWWLFLLVGVFAFSGFAVRWLYLREKAQQQIEEPEQELIPLPPQQQIWSIPADTPHWETRA